MNSRKTFRLLLPLIPLLFGLFGILFSCSNSNNMPRMGAMLTKTVSATEHNAKIVTDVALSYNDLSYLWPVPQNAAEVDMLISANTVMGNTSVWPAQNFKDVIDMAQNKLEIPNIPSPPKYKQITFVYNGDSSLLKRENWKIVGFRVDPSAPSTSDENVIKNFGVVPQIRLILQPVTVNEGKVTVHDFTVHLPYSYTTNTSLPFKPDTVAFKNILTDVFKLKKYLKDTSEDISTDGLLQVNQALANKVPGYAKEVEKLLSKHLPAGRLEFVAFMGLAPRPEPWVFFNMATGAKFQLLNTLNTRNMASKPINGPNTNWEAGKGVSTAVLFHANVKLDQPAIEGTTKPLNKDIPNIIANPTYSNVLNTDCVSCHSESTRRNILKLEGNSDYEFSAEQIVKKELLPTDIYNVRNFGWFGVVTEKPRPIISMRAANETANVLKYINTHYVSNTAQPN